MKPTHCEFDEATRQLVRDTWAEITPIADTATELFYRNLFERHPSVKPLFRHVDMPAQRERLVHAIDAVVNTLDRFDDMAPLLEDLGRRHHDYGVRHSHYAAVGDALLITLAQGLGDAWNDAVESAWTRLYQRVSALMQGAEEPALQATG